MTFLEVLQTNNFSCKMEVGTQTVTCYATYVAVAVNYKCS